MTVPSAGVREIRATVYSVGGAVLVALCILFTVIALFISRTPEATALQRGILALFTVAAWVYFVNSCTERLRLIDHAVEYTALFSSRRRVSLDQLESIAVIHQGFNMEKGMEMIELRRRDGTSHRISLGPCWQRRMLEAFLRALENTLQDAHRLEEVR